MTNFFPMIPAANFSGVGRSGNVGMTGKETNATDSLFSLLLQKLNGESGTAVLSQDPALLMDSTLTDLAAGSMSTDSNGIVLNNNTGKKITKSSIHSLDLTLPAAVAPQLISFLKTKGFSTDQIDKMILSSTNEGGFVQLDKLVAAMKSTGNKTIGSGITANQRPDSGLVVENASIPKVEETLFNMGLGVGDVKSVIENSTDQDGSLSLDKLTNALKGIASTGNITRAELVSTLSQNDIGVKSQATDVAAVTTSEMNNIKSNINPVDDALNTDASTNANDSEIKKAALDLKREFTSFTREVRSHRPKISNLPRVRAVHSQEINSVNDMNTGSDINALDISKTLASASVPEAGQSSNQALPKGQTKWQKSIEGKIINILGNEDASISRADEKTSLVQQKTDMILEFKDALKQGDQKVKQEITSAIASGNTAAETDTASARGSNADILNFNEATPVAGLDSQSIARISEVVDLKIKAKSAYNLPEPLPRVLDRMVIMIKNGEQTGKLIIQPPELGKIDINLTIKDGHIHASLSAENYAVKEIIETNLNQLKQQLTDQGLIVEQFNVSVGSQHKQFQDENSQAWNNGAGSFQSGTDDISEVTSISDTASGMMNSRYRVDVRV
jgi:flagellar hook-length control protein FliK